MYVIEIRIVKIKKIWYHGLNISSIQDSYAEVLTLKVIV